MKILVFPYDCNPYQKLLYTAMRDNYHVKVSYIRRFPVIGALHVPFVILLFRLRGYRIIHIHWIAFYINLPLTHSKIISTYNTRLNLWLMGKLGIKIVWTVHDITPHDPETSNDIDISRRLSRKANAKIALSNYTVSQMEFSGLNIARTAMIPHGNYAGVYPDKISMHEARKQLGINKNEFVILFFGIIKPYKGVVELVEAFKKINNPNARLIIAGNCVDASIRDKIRDSEHQYNIDFYDEYVATEDVAKYFIAADVVCLPFKSVTASGSTILALTFGRPIIAPRTGALKDLPENVGIFYEPKEPKSLEASLSKALASNSAELKEMSKNAEEYSETLSWDKIAGKTYRLYESVLRK